MLAPEKLAEITGRKTVHTQMAWLDDNRWQYELAADGDGAMIVVHGRKPRRWRQPFKRNQEAIRNRQ